MDETAKVMENKKYQPRLYEVNIWMWRYGWGSPRMVSITEAERIGASVPESRTRAAETRKRHSEATAAAGAAVGGCRVH